jgi:hypothetical protein
MVIEDVYNGIKTGKELIEKLGNVKYPFKSKPRYSYLFD